MLIKHSSCLKRLFCLHSLARIYCCKSTPAVAVGYKPTVSMRLRCRTKLEIAAAPQTDHAASHTYLWDMHLKKPSEKCIINILLSCPPANVPELVRIIKKKTIIHGRLKLKWWPLCTAPYVFTSAGRTKGGVL